MLQLEKPVWQWDTDHKHAMGAKYSRHRVPTIATHIREAWLARPGPPTAHACRHSDTGKRRLPLEKLRQRALRQHGRAKHLNLRPNNSQMDTAGRPPTQLGAPAP